MLTNQESKEEHTLSKLELCIKENGKGHLEMGMEHKHGQMEQLLLDNGKTTKLMAKVNLLMLTETHMKVSGQMIKRMGLVFTTTSMAQNMWAFGKMIYNMASELKHG